MMDSGPSKARITLQVDAVPDIINQVLRRFTDFLNNSLLSIHMQIYFEPIDTGVLVFFNRLTDFQQFHQMLQKLADMAISNNPSIFRSSELNDPHSDPSVKLNFILTFNHTDRPIAELMELIIQSYQKITQEVQIERISDNNVILTYPNMLIFARLTSIIQDYLEKQQNNQSE